MNSDIRPIPTPERDVTKLPKWAQDHIRALTWAAQERDSALHRQMIEDVSRVKVAYKPIYFPEHTNFGFVFGAESHHNEVHVGFRGEWVDVRTTGSRMVVRPEASNVIHVRPADG